MPMHFATHVFFIFTVTALNIKTVEDTDTEIGTETGMEIETETDTHTHTYLHNMCIPIQTLNITCISGLISNPFFIKFSCIDLFLYSICKY
mgnify:CR=1 FL=1